MQLRKTLYPIAVLIAIPLVIMVFYFLNQGKFEEHINKEEMSDGDTKETDAFLNYTMQWKGFGSPIIQDITFSGPDALEISAVFIDSLEGKEMEVEETEQGAYRIQLPAENLDHKQLKLLLQVSAETMEEKNLFRAFPFVIKHSVLQGHKRCRDKLTSKERGDKAWTKLEVL
ncbi:MAG TPA: hypothetical protein VK108_11380 [Pseudogracilibacillus sp.]|nr:hypothetical protein [Pseudogracilibacillus sp.]